MRNTFAALIALSLPCAAALADPTIDWYTIDGGGGTSAGGTFTLSGTIGQPDAGVLSGGTFTLNGGFWAGVIPGYVMLGCQPADIADDQGTPLGDPNRDPQVPNTGVNEGDYNAFFQGFFSAEAYCDFADDQGTPLNDPARNPLVPNSGVNEGDYNAFFQLFFLGCP